MKKEPLSYHLSPVMCFQVFNFTYFGIKTAGLGKVVIQNWDHLDIKTISASPIGGLNCEVPLYLFAHSTKVTYLALLTLWSGLFHETCHSVTFYLTKQTHFLILTGNAFYQIMVMSDKTTSDIIRTYIFNLFHSVLKGLTCWLKAIENLSPKLPHYNVLVTLILIKFCQNQALSTPNWISNILV